MKIVAPHTIISKPLPQDTNLEVIGNIVFTCPVNIQSLKVDGNVTIKDHFSTDCFICNGNLISYGNLDIITGIITGNCTIYDGADFDTLDIRMSLTNFGELLGSDLTIGKKFFSLYYVTVDSLTIGGQCSTITDYLVVNKKLCVRGKTKFYPESCVKWEHFGIPVPYCKR